MIRIETINGAPQKRLEKSFENILVNSDNKDRVLMDHEMIDEVEVEIQIDYIEHQQICLFLMLLLRNTETYVWDATECYELEIETDDEIGEPCHHRLLHDHDETYEVECQQVMEKVGEVMVIYSIIEPLSRSRKH